MEFKSIGIGRKTLQTLYRNQPGAFTPSDDLPNNIFFLKEY